MNPQDIGSNIYLARKKSNLTQRELGDKIGVTDKAISKWERGLGCPDISLLLPLCKHLNIDIAELLKDENVVEDKKTKDVGINQFAEYAKMKFATHKESIHKFICIALGISSIVAIIICLVVDYLLFNTFTWSLIASTAILYGLSIILTLLLSKKRQIAHTLTTGSVLLMPLLYVISHNAELKSFYPKAYFIALGAILLAWIIYGISFHLKTNIWIKLLMILFVSTIFNIFVNMYTNTDMKLILTHLISNIGALLIIVVIRIIITTRHYN